MPIIQQSMITRRDLQANPTALYVFGDNLARVGLGGQAAAMRGEPNSVGLPTKRSPWDYLTDQELDIIIQVNKDACERIYDHLTAQGIVIWPLDGIGTGLADLPRRAPTIMQYYNKMFAFWRTL